MTRTIYSAPAIHCEGCANSIQRSLGKLPGIASVNVEVASRRVDVEYDPEQTPEPAIRERLALAGFPAEPVDE
jgi:copper chaperone CopZ